MQIAIGNRGNRMFTFHAMWKTFMERRADIERSTVPSSSSSIQDLNVELVKIYDTNNMKLTLNGICLYMKPTTLLFLFELEQCVKQFSMN